MTTYVHLELRRISCRCSTSRKKDARPKIIERFYVHKAASLHKQLYHKHTIFPQYKFDTILKNKSFNPTVFLMPSIFYIPIHISPTPHSQTMAFLLSVGFQCSHSAQQWAVFTHRVQYTTPYQYTVNNCQAHINTVHHVVLHWQLMWDIITFK